MSCFQYSATYYTRSNKGCPSREWYKRDIVCIVSTTARLSWVCQCCAVFLFASILLFYEALIKFPTTVSQLNCVTVSYGTTVHKIATAPFPSPLRYHNNANAALTLRKRRSGQWTDRLQGTKITMKIYTFVYIYGVFYYLPRNKEEGLKLSLFLSGANFFSVLYAQYQYKTLTT